MMKNYFLLVLVATVLFACGKKQNETKPSYMKITEGVYASGNIYPKNDYSVFANADGFLIDPLVSEGSIVKKGQPMFRIESDMQEFRYEASYDVYRKALENYSEDSPALKEIQAGIETSRARFLNDSLNYVRYKNLYDNKATSDLEFEKARLAYQQSRNDYQARLNNYSRTRNQLYVELKNAESQYKVNAKDKSNYLVTSFIDGMVYDVYKQKGEAVRKNEAIALVGDSKEVYLKLQIDELDIAKIQVGQKVLIKIDVYKDKVFNAKVTKIYPKLNKEDQSFRVDAEFEGETPGVYYGLTVEANIIVATKEKALVIPKNLLATQDSVLTIVDGEKKMVKINKGLQDLDYVEVLSGLNENSVIVQK